MTEPDVVPSAEAVREAAHRLSPQYNYDAGFQAGLAAGGGLWKKFTIVAVIGWMAALAMMVIAIIY